MSCEVVRRFLAFFSFPRFLIGCSWVLKCSLPLGKILTNWLTEWLYTGTVVSYHSLEDCLCPSIAVGISFSYTYFYNYLSRPSSGSRIPVNLPVTLLLGCKLAELPAFLLPSTWLHHERHFTLSNLHIGVKRMCCRYVCIGCYLLGCWECWLAS